MAARLDRRDWDVFGNGQLVFHLFWHVSWWQRLMTRLLLGSKWTRINEEKKDADY